MLCVMGFVGAFCINIMRNNLSVGIVFMTDQNTTTGNHSTATDEAKDLMRQMNIGLTKDYYSLYGSSTNGNGKGAIETQSLCFCSLNNLLFYLPDYCVNGPLWHLFVCAYFT